MRINPKVKRDIRTRLQMSRSNNDIFKLTIKDKILIFPIIGLLFVSLGAICFSVGVITEQLVFFRLFGVCLMLGIIVGIVPLMIKMILADA